MYARLSCIQPMFHLWLKPRPPSATGRLTPGQAVDSSAITSAPGVSLATTWLR